MVLIAPTLLMARLEMRASILFIRILFFWGMKENFSVVSIDRTC